MIKRKFEGNQYTNQYTNENGTDLPSASAKKLKTSSELSQPIDTL